MFTVYMGYDRRETEAYNVAEFSIKNRSSGPVAVVPLDLNTLVGRGLMWRKIEMRDGKMWDVVSQAPQATEFATSRFLTPILHENVNRYSGWAVFMDCDVLCRTDITQLQRSFDPRFAVMCVKHKYTPSTHIKMDGQIQTLYSRKNWSSVMAFNCDHPKNRNLTVSMVNETPGRDLHNFCWLEDSDIGELSPEWNALIGEPGYDFSTAKIAHYTLGGPWMGVENSEEADSAWIQEHKALALKRGYKLV
jgi:hypothetical protein